MLMEQNGGHRWVSVTCLRCLSGSDHHQELESEVQPAQKFCVRSENGKKQVG